MSGGGSVRERMNKTWEAPSTAPGFESPQGTLVGFSWVRALGNE